MKSALLVQTSILLEDWGSLAYEEAFSRQEQLVSELQQGLRGDTLVLVEHPPVVTLGRRASNDDLRLPAKDFSSVNVGLQEINRGGLATAHEPGQLVVYPIVELKIKDLRWFANTFLGVVVAVLKEFGLQGDLKEGEPGVWVEGRKICSFGIAVKKWVTSHGVAINVNNDLSTFNLIVPCGRPQEKVTSVSRELNLSVNMTDFKQKLVEHFLVAFACKLQP